MSAKLTRRGYKRTSNSKAPGIYFMKDRKKIKKEADKWFSKFIRLRDSINGVRGQCITCGKTNDIKKMDCGHYMKRQHMATRYDEKNCNLQCKRCNAFEQGANEIYKKRIDKKYGAGTSDMLELKARTTYKISNSELELLANHYKNQYLILQMDK